MKIFAGSSNPILAQEIASSFGGLGQIRIDSFSDGELSPQYLESVRNEDVYIIQSGITAKHNMELFLMIDAAKRNDAHKISIIMPYHAYCRMDKIDGPRGPIGAKMIADILSSLGVSRIISIDLHSAAIQGFYDIPVVCLEGRNIFKDVLKEFNDESFIICSPDQGGVARAEKFRKFLPKTGFAFIIKKRVKPNEINSMILVGDVKDKHVLLIDDIADTCGTLSKAVDELLAKGAKSVRAVITHPILSGKAFDIIEKSNLTELIVSNTIEHDPLLLPKKVRVVSCHKFLVEAIKGLEQKISIETINSNIS